MYECMNVYINTYVVCYLSHGHIDSAKSYMYICTHTNTYIHTYIHTWCVTLVTAILTAQSPMCVYICIYIHTHTSG